VADQEVEILLLKTADGIHTNNQVMLPQVLVLKIPVVVAVVAAILEAPHTDQAAMAVLV
jgi:hypothetical protein